MRKWIVWMAWVMGHVASYAFPIYMAWAWLDSERQGRVASGDPMGASHDTPPILAIMSACFTWTLLLICLNLVAAAIWWFRRRRVRAGTGQSTGARITRPPPTSRA